MVPERVGGVLGLGAPLGCAMECLGVAIVFVTVLKAWFKSLQVGPSGSHISGPMAVMWDHLSPYARRRLLKLRRARVPAVLLQVVALCFLGGLVDEWNVCLDGIEFFAGIGTIASGLERRGLNSFAFDINNTGPG